MDNQAQKQTTDIAEQTYQGPGAAIASLGYGMVDFKISSAAAAIIGIGISLTAPKGTAKQLSQFEQSVSKLNASSNPFKKSIGWSGQKFADLGKWCQSNIPFKEHLRRLVGEEKWEPVSRLTGMLAALGFVATFFTGAGRGITSANAGKAQLAEAQNEIRQLRTAIANQQIAAAPLPPQDASAPGNGPRPHTRIDASSAEHAPLLEAEKAPER